MQNCILFLEEISTDISQFVFYFLVLPTLVKQSLNTLRTSLSSIIPELIFYNLTKSLASMWLEKLYFHNTHPYLLPYLMLSNKFLQLYCLLPVFRWFSLFMYCEKFVWEQVLFVFRHFSCNYKFELEQVSFRVGQSISYLYLCFKLYFPSRWLLNWCRFVY